MATPASVVEQRGFADQQAARARKEQLEDEKRQTQLSTLLQNASTAQDAMAAIDAVYAHEPHQTRLGRLYDHLTGKKAAPLPAPAVTATTGAITDPETGEQINAGQQVTVKGPAPKTRQEAIEGVTARGITPEQRAINLEQMRENSQLQLQRLRNEGVAARGGTSRPVPYYAGAIDKADAISTQNAGKVYKDANGEPIDASKIPDGMFLLPVFAGNGQEYYELGTDKGRYETADNQRKFEPSVGNPNPNAPSIGAARVPTERTSTTTDPFGLTTTTNTRTSPVAPGGPAPRAGATSSARPAAVTPGLPAPRRPQGQGAQPATTPGKKELDAQGHIPAGAGNPYLVQIANSIIDGADVTKTAAPQKVRAAAMQLASDYGWKGQGLFTPREVLQLKEGAAVIQKMLNSDSLSVLDKGTIANLPMLAQSADPTKENLWGRLTTSMAAKSSSPQQQEFLRYWRQLDALAVGLRALVQTGRATQTQVNRIIAELPNPYNTTSAADARARLQMVQAELKVAADTGRLPDVPLGQPAAAPAGTPKQGATIVVRPEDM